MSKRSDILDAIKTTIATLNTIKNIEIDRMDSVDLGKLPLPAVFIYSGNDNRIESGDDATIGFETWSWEIFIEVWAKDTDMESLLADIHRAMFQNYRFNGLADYSVRYGSEAFIVDPTRRIKGILLKYRVLFRHPLGQP